jgi:hypothetical protein
MDLGQTSTYLTHSSGSLVALDFSFSIFFPAKVGTQIFLFVCRKSAIFLDVSVRKYSYAGKENIRGKPMWIWIRNTVFFLANLRICDLRTGTPRKFSDFRFAD